jgi:hypothetical protein
MRRGWIGLWIAAACRADDVASADADGAAYLSGAHPPERARVAVTGEARLRQDGPAIEGPTSPTHDLTLVVVDADQRVRARWDDHNVSLLLWLDREDLADVVVVDAAGWGAPDQPGAVWWPAGASVTWADGWATASSRGAMVRSRLHPSDVDQVWVEPAVRRVVAPMAGDVAAHGGVLDGPGGRPLLWTDDGEPVRVERTGRVDGAWREVRWVDELQAIRRVADVEVFGWVREDNLAPVERHFSWVGDCGFRSGLFQHDGGNIPAGAKLRDEPGGAVVGKTRRAMQVDVDHAGIGEVDVATPWGATTLYVDHAEEPLPR